jgi:hypothetical protein
LTNLIAAVPAPAIKYDGTEAVTCVALITVVASGEPFHCTTEPVQLVPVTVRMKVDDAAIADMGRSTEMVGGGG